MGSPLSPVIADIYMEHLETLAMSSSNLKPTCWLRYVDDTFVICPHGKDTFDLFLSHMNGIHPSIQFAMEVESEASLPFLNVIIQKQPSHSFSYSVYRKPTHTNWYLNSQSHHHPAQPSSVGNTLVSRSIRLSDDKHRPSKINSIRQTLLQNGYHKSQINRSIQKHLNPIPSNTESFPPYQPQIFLLFIKGVTDKISRTFTPLNIKTVFTTHSKLSNLLPTDIHRTDKPTNPKPYLLTFYICKIFRHYFNLSPTSYSDRSQNRFGGSKTITLVYSLKSRIIRKAIEIEKCPDSLNTRDDAKRLSATWRPLLQRLTAPTDPAQASLAHTIPVHTESIKAATQAKTGRHSTLSSRQVETSVPLDRSPREQDTTGKSRVRE
uniref:Uncharacterized protein LOC114324533 n=1 Tax=Diabrotica virgifera virgifera TaxID=50390 RepID=A0A6P7F3W8_DIAVI